MDVPLWLILILALGTVCRLTRLVVADSITIPIHEWVESKFGGNSFLAQLISCPWCFSMWVAPPVSVVAYFAGDSPWFVIPALCLTLSYVTALIAQNLDSE